MIVIIIYIAIIQILTYIAMYHHNYRLSPPQLSGVHTISSSSSTFFRSSLSLSIPSPPVTSLPPPYTIMITIQIITDSQVSMITIINTNTLIITRLQLLSKTNSRAISIHYCMSHRNHGRITSYAIVMFANFEG